MLKVDLIIPFFFKKKIYHINRISLNRWRPDWLRIKNNKNQIKEKGIKIRFLNYLNLDYSKLSNIVTVDYRILSNLGIYNANVKSPNHLIIAFLKKLRKFADYIILFDNKDSADIQFEVLPYVDKYLKKNLYKDRSLYLKVLYGYRIHADYYARNYNLDKYSFFEPGSYSNYIRNVNIDNEKEHEKQIKLYKDNEKKIYLSWNLAFSDYREQSILKNPFFLYFSKKNIINYYRPSSSRRIQLSGNFKFDYETELISFQRKKMLKFLIEHYRSNPHVSLGGVPKKEYLKILRSSKAIVSPFGWGEVCYRDFEAFIAGAALIKPDMDHLDTWPNLYKMNKTYMPLSWKIEDWKSEFDNILSDEKNLLEVAQNGQEEYKKLWTKEGNEEFCERFIKLVSPNS